MDTVPIPHPPGNGSGAASPTPSPHPLDKLTDATTAFSTWHGFCERLAAGYVPTVRATSRRKRLLIRAIHAAGFRTWPPAEARKAVTHA